MTNNNKKDITMTTYIFWWLIAFILFIIELMTPATLFIFPAVIAGLVGILALFLDDIFIQALLFFGFSVITLIKLRPLFVTSKNDIGYKQGAVSLIGKQLRVVEEINNQKDQGKVKRASDIFPARSGEGDIISVGSLVEVISMDGITVTVKKVYY